MIFLSNHQSLFPGRFLLFFDMYSALDSMRWLVQFFSFLPICQLYGAHATVDVFTSFLPERANRWIAAFWEVVLAAVILLIVNQLFGGMERYMRNGQTTLFLQFPVWWAYAASFAAGVIACITAVYCAALRIGEAVKDRSILPSEHAEHWDEQPWIGLLVLSHSVDHGVSTRAHWACDVTVRFWWLVHGDGRQPYAAIG